MAFPTPEIQSGRAAALTALEFSDFSYTPKYCEENVYMLCKRLCSAGVATPEGSDLFVVFISNANRQIPLWHQKASREFEGLTIWDYHVICVQKCIGKDVQVQVWDLDTMLPFPVPLYQYINEAIRPWFPLNPKLRRLFRVVSAPIFLRFFASDRRHMKDVEGNWVAPPPLHNCITAEDGTVHNLNAFISMCEENVNSKLEEARENLFQIQTGVVIDESCEPLKKSSLRILRVHSKWKPIKKRSRVRVCNRRQSELEKAVRAKEQRNLSQYQSKADSFYAVACTLNL